MKADPRKETGIKLVAVEISLTFGNRKWQPHKNSGAKDEEAKFNKRTKYKMRIRVFAFYWGALWNFTRLVNGSL